MKSQDAFVTTSSGTKHRRQMTQEFSVSIKWCDGNTAWVALKKFKEAYPVQFTEYTVAANISIEPAFSWWFPHTLKTRNHISCKI